MDKICQIAIILFGCSSIWMVGREESWRKWGFIIGLFGQPFWIHTAITHKQWGIFILACWYTYAWAQGAWNFIIKPIINKC
jgi:hypothetical protein